MPAPSPYDFIHPQGNYFARIIEPRMMQQWQLSYNEALMQRQEAREDAMAMAKFRLEFSKQLDSEIERYEKFVNEWEKKYQEADTEAKRRALDKEFERQKISFEEKGKAARQNASEFGRSSRAGARDRAILGKDAQEQRWEDEEADINRSKTVWNTGVDNQRPYRAAWDSAMDKYVGGVFGPESDPTRVGKSPQSEDLRILTRQLHETPADKKVRMGGDPSLTIIDGIYDTYKDDESRGRALSIARDELRNMDQPELLTQFDKLVGIRDRMDMTKSDFMNKNKSAGSGNPAYQTVNPGVFSPDSKLGDFAQGMREELAPNEEAYSDVLSRYKGKLDELRAGKESSADILNDLRNSSRSTNTIDSARRIFASRFGGARRTTRLQDQLALLSPGELADVKDYAYNRVHERPPLPPPPIEPKEALKGNAPQDTSEPTEDDTKLPGGTGMIPLPATPGKGKKVNLPFDPSTSPKKVELAGGVPTKQDQVSTHMNQIQDAMYKGKQLAMQNNKLDRILANDPVSKEASRLWAIDAKNQVPLQDQIAKISKAFSNDPVKQSRALQVLFALRARDTSSHYLKSPGKEVDLANKGIA